jgi:hypothetical protein
MIIGNYSVCCIIAESVRQEVDNRVSIIGTYNLGFHIPIRDAPTLIPAGLYITVQPALPPGTILKCRITLNEATLTQMELTAPEGGNEPLSATNIAVSGSAMPVNAGDIFCVHMVIDESPEAKIGELKFIAPPES